MSEDGELKDFMQEWFAQFMGRFDRLDKFMEIMSGRHNVLNGERLLDNQDLCQMLNVSKRTLQRYRSAGELTYITIHHKIFYTESNVEKFICDHFAEGEPTNEYEPFGRNVQPKEDRP